MVLGYSPEKEQSYGTSSRHVSNGRRLFSKSKTESRSKSHGQLRSRWKSACKVIKKVEISMIMIQTKAFLLYKSM